MREEDVYLPLSFWMEKNRGFDWYRITHENPCLIFNEEEERAEADVCLGFYKGKQLVLTDAIHVKTKDNLKNKTERYQLLGKAKATLNSIRNIWLAIEKSSYSVLKDSIDEKIGIIVYTESNDSAGSFTIKKEPQRNDVPLFQKETQVFFDEKFGPEIRASRDIFICSMDKINWPICIKHKLWGVPKGASQGESAIQRAKPGDILLFRLVKDRGEKIGFVGIWMVTSLPFKDENGGPWKNENPGENRDFIWQVRMYPMLVNAFNNPFDLDYPKNFNKETGIHTKMYMAGMVRINDLQYKIISQQLIEKNLNQLQ